jgi:hypothetical protein
VLARAYYPGASHALADSMPRSWVYMMVLLVICLLASIVIAAVRLL